jgi:pyruvyltransferase
MRNKVLLARWYEARPNWGDALNPVLIEKISGQRPVNLQHSRWGYWKLRQSFGPWPLPEYMAIGSILGWGSRRPGVTVFWGSGFMFAEEPLRARPRQVCAVRGPLSREKLLKLGVDCPPVYGDPAVLYPRYYRPSVPKRYKLGIIPHYSEAASPWVASLKGREDIKVVDVALGVEAFVDVLLACEKVASSSLHGVIAADAYGIPSLWIAFSADLLPRTVFKFNDYFAGVGRPAAEAFMVREDTQPEEILRAVRQHDIVCDTDRLLEACPFRRT